MQYDNNHIQAELHEAFRDVATMFNVTRGSFDAIATKAAELERLHHCARDSPRWRETLACLLEAFEALQHSGLILSRLNSQLSRQLSDVQELEARRQVLQEGWELHLQHAGTRGDPICIDIPASEGPGKRKRPEGGDSCDQFEQTRCPRLMHPWEFDCNQPQNTCSETLPSEASFGDIQLDSALESLYSNFNPFGTNFHWQNGVSEGSSSTSDDDVTLGSSSEV